METAISRIDDPLRRLHREKPAPATPKSRGLPVAVRLPAVRSTRLPPRTPKSLTAAFRGFQETVPPPARSERKVACCPRYPAGPRFARLLATNSRAWGLGARPAHAAEEPLSIMEAPATRSKHAAFHCR